MDDRLLRIGGIRPGKMLKSNCPDLAKAIVLFAVADVQVVRDFRGGLEYVRFSGSAVNVVVLARDWDLVLPYVRDGYFESVVYPTPRTVVRDPMYDDPTLETSPNRPMYDRVLSKLQELFPDDYPNP
jgi:hypothetical protein